MKNVALILSFLFVALGAGLVRGESLIDNGTFDTNFDPWTNPNQDVTQQWSDLDAADLVGSGSIRVTSTSTSNGVTGSWQCIVLGERPLPSHLRADVLVPPQEPNLNGRLYLKFSPDAFCGSSGAVLDFAESVLPSEAWQPIVHDFTAPEGTQSIAVTLGIWRDPSAGSNYAYFDNVYLPEPNAPALLATILATLACVRVWRAG